MKKQNPEVERLRIENQFLRLQLEVVENQNLCLLRSGTAELENKILLMRTIDRQQQVIKSVVRGE